MEGEAAVGIGEDVHLVDAAEEDLLALGVVEVASDDVHRVAARRRRRAGDARDAREEAPDRLAGLAPDRVAEARHRAPRDRLPGRAALVLHAGRREGGVRRVAAAVRPRPLPVAVLGVAQRDDVVGRAVDHHRGGGRRLAEEVAVGVVALGRAVGAAPRVRGDGAEDRGAEAAVQEVREEPAAREAGREDAAPVDVVARLEVREDVLHELHVGVPRERRLEVEGAPRLLGGVGIDEDRRAARLGLEPEDVAQARRPCRRRRGRRGRPGRRMPHRRGQEPSAHRCAPRPTTRGEPRGRRSPDRGRRAARRHRTGRHRAYRRRPTDPCRSTRGVAARRVGRPVVVARLSSSLQRGSARSGRGRRSTWRRSPCSGGAPSGGGSRIRPGRPRSRRGRARGSGDRPPRARRRARPGRRAAG